MTSTLTEIASASTLKLTGVDLASATKRFSTDPSKMISIAEFKLGKSAIKAQLQGSLSTEGIKSHEFDKITRYTIGIKLDEEDEEAITSILTKIEEFTKSNSPEEWEILNPIKDQVIYLKLKTDFKKKSFQLKSNLKLDPRKLEDQPLERGNDVAANLTLQAYFNLKDHRAGLTFTPTSMSFQVEEEEQLPVLKKHKKD